MNSGCNNPNCPIHGDHGLIKVFEDLSSAFGGFPGGRGGLPLMVGDMTAISIGADGSVQRTRIGTSLTSVPLDSVVDLHDDVMPALTDYRDLAKRITDEKDRAATLRQEAGILEGKIKNQEVELRFAISEILPPEKSEWYGDARLMLIDSKSAVLVNICPDVNGAVVITNDSLLDRQDEIKELKEQLDQMNMEAARLERQASTLPDLLNLKLRTAKDLFKEHVVPSYRDNDDVLTVGVDFDREGNPMVVTEHRIDESGDELSPEELALMTASLRLKMSRGDVGEIPEPVRQLLKLDEPTAEITDDTDQSAVRTEEPSTAPSP